jgi:hypothetical protein
VPERSGNQFKAFAIPKNKQRAAAWLDFCVVDWAGRSRRHDSRDQYAQPQGHGKDWDALRSKRR